MMSLNFLKSGEERRFFGLFRHIVGEMLGVNATDMECLGVILFKGLTTPSELAQYTGLSSGATTAMLDRLEKSELIARHPNPKDRRSTHIRKSLNTSAKLKHCGFKW